MKKKVKRLNKDELLSAWSYVKSVTDRVKGLTCNKRFKFIVSGCDEVGIYYESNRTVIAINGSDKDFDEWRSNLNALPTKNGKHKSYEADGVKIYDDIVDIVPMDKPVMIVGHSRGAPLGQVVAEVFYNLQGVVVTVISFGSPRVFTARGSKRQNFIHHRVKSRGDIVTRVPPMFIPPIPKKTFPFFSFPVIFKHYQTHKYVIRAGKVLGIVKKHGKYGEMIEEYMK